MPEKLLPYLIRHLQEWQQFALIEPQSGTDPLIASLETAIQQYLRSAEPHPLFDSAVVVWWNEFHDHALLVPCALHAHGRHLVTQDAKAFRLVRTKPLSSPQEKAASSS